MYMMATPPTVLFIIVGLMLYTTAVFAADQVWKKHYEDAKMVDRVGYSQYHDIKKDERLRAKLPKRRLPGEPFVLGNDICDLINFPREDTLVARQLRIRDVAHDQTTVGDDNVPQIAPEQPAVKARRTRRLPKRKPAKSLQSMSGYLRWFQRQPEVKHYVDSKAMIVSIAKQHAKSIRKEKAALEAAVKAEGGDPKHVGYRPGFSCSSYFDEKVEEAATGTFEDGRLDLSLMKNVTLELIATLQTKYPFAYKCPKGGDPARMRERNAPSPSKSGKEPVDPTVASESVTEATEVVAFLFDRIADMGVTERIFSVQPETSAVSVLPPLSARERQLLMPSFRDWPTDDIDDFCNSQLSQLAEDGNRIDRTPMFWPTAAIFKALRACEFRKF